MGLMKIFKKWGWISWLWDSFENMKFGYGAHQDQISDWFASLAECLHWNVRKKQKAMDELSDLSRSSSTAIENQSSQTTEGNGESSVQVENSTVKAEVAKV